MLKYFLGIILATSASAQINLTLPRGATGVMTCRDSDVTIRTALLPAERSVRMVCVAPSPAPGPTPVPTPTPAATPSPSPTPVGSGEVSLGTLPFAVQWPQAPVTTATVEVRTPAEMTAALTRPASRIVVRADLAGTYSLASSDMVIEASGYAVGTLTIQRSTHRVRILGGRWQRIEAMAPYQYWPTEESRDEWFVTDLMIDGAVMDASGIALALRGKRVAVVRSVARAGTYSLWFGDHGPQQASDVIVAGNHFTSAGAEATLRIHDAHRVVVVDNVLVNGTKDVTSKHNLRLHGTVDRALLARNTLIWSGSMVGINDSGDTDILGEIWFEANEFYQTRMSGFRADAAHITTLHLNRNVMRSNLHSCILCIPTPAGWEVQGNQILPYGDPAASLMTR